MPVGIPDEVVAELIRYARRGEVLQFDSLVQGLVDNLRRHGAANAADNIRAANHAGTGLNLADGPAAGKKAGPIKVPAQFADFLFLKTPDRILSELVLEPRVAAAVQEVIRDYHARERLEAHGLKPSRTLLMHGPPGNGKTSVAGALAAALSLPLYILRMGGLEESLVGLTEKKMIAAFDCLKAGPAMLFMDEADSILGTRTSVNHGSDAHRNGAINTMLQLIDETEAHTYLVAATNRAGDMDAAILRRFELHLELPRPTAAGLAEFFRGFVRAKAGDYPVTLDPAEVGLYAELRGDSFATLEQRCTRALRSHVIELPRSVLDQHLRAQLLPHAEPARSGDLEVAATENPAPRGRKRATAPRAAAPQPAEAAA